MLTLVSFPQKSSFNTIVQFGSNFDQNHANLYKWFALLNFEMQYDEVQ